MKKIKNNLNKPCFVLHKEEFNFNLSICFTPDEEIGAGWKHFDVKKAKADFEKGQYQWVAEITSALVFRNPKNEEARFLNADALEQLGFQQETATWRNAYLTAASELRDINHELPHASAFLADSGFGISEVLKQLNGGTKSRSYRDST